MTERLQVKRFILGLFDTNCYLVSDQSSKQALIIDPAEENREVIATIEKDGLNVIGIVNTHSHGDHIGGNGSVKAKFGCPILIHEADAPALTDAYKNLSALVGLDNIVSPPADRLLKDGDEIFIGRYPLKVIHTPGHSPGGICLHTDDIIFTGDTLFAGSIGRCDFPGCSFEQLMASIHELLLLLNDDTKVYPGHGPETTIGNERAHNPWI
ncbi:MAG: MBL fold metallo-hydrolase [Armatimonadetes bacterium]|nr:MBL fold metallo-hydrolase [Armatimonadota bacterium]